MKEIRYPEKPIEDPLSRVSPKRVQAPVVQKLDSPIHRLNYQVDKYYGNQLRYPLDSDFSKGYHYPPLEQPGPVGLRLIDLEKTP